MTDHKHTRKSLLLTPKQYLSALKILSQLLEQKDNALTIEGLQTVHKVIANAEITEEGQTC